MIDFSRLTQPLPASASLAQRKFTIGIPAADTTAERRFPLTPEGAQMLVENGYSVRIQEGAAKVIHYSDANYTRRGAEIVSRDEALAADIVIHLPQLPVADVMKMRRGAMLLTLLNISTVDPHYIKALVSRSIISIALDLIKDSQGNRPFADILNEIAGRAALSLGSALLANSFKGKGILLGGVAGIVPCEVMIIGSGIAAVAAARSACGLGAMVRMFDNNLYSLRTACRELGPQVIASALHRNVVDRAIQSADMVVMTPVSDDVRFSQSQVDMMKKGVITFDLSSGMGAAFPSMRVVDSGAEVFEELGLHGRVCYINTGNAVPRTAAMALSNSFITMFGELLTLADTSSALKLSRGLQAGAVTFLGKVVNSDVAAKVGVRSQDISLFIQFS